MAQTILGDPRLASQLVCCIKLLERHMWTANEFMQRQLYFDVLEMEETGVSTQSAVRHPNKNAEAKLAKQTRTRGFGLPHQVVLGGVVDKTRPEDMIAMARYDAKNRGTPERHGPFPPSVSSLVRSCVWWCCVWCGGHMTAMWCVQVVFASSFASV